MMCAMKIHIEYEAEVPDTLINNDFCSKHSGAKCSGLTDHYDYRPVYCKRFSTELKYYLSRPQKCEACIKARAEAVDKKRAGV